MSSVDNYQWLPELDSVTILHLHPTDLCNIWHWNYLLGDPLNFRSEFQLHVRKQPNTALALTRHSTGVGYSLFLRITHDGFPVTPDFPQLDLFLPYFLHRIFFPQRSPEVLFWDLGPSPYILMDGFNFPVSENDS